MDNKSKMIELEGVWVDSKHCYTHIKSIGVILHGS
jgi:hypothetical protein